MTLPSPNPPPARAQGFQPGSRRDNRRLRQIAWASVPVWSIGLLSFVPFLRLAIARRRPRDWAVFAAYLAVVATLLVLTPGSGQDGGRSGLVGGALILLIPLATVHALVAFRPGPDPLGSGSLPSLPSPSNQHALLPV